MHSRIPPQAGRTRSALPTLRASDRPLPRWTLALLLPLLLATLLFSVSAWAQNSSSDGGSDGETSEPLLVQPQTPGETLTLVQRWINESYQWVIENGPAMLINVVLFLLILIVFRVFAGLGKGLMRRAVAKTDMSELLKNFFVSVTGNVILLLGLLVGLAQLGIQLGPLLAGLGVAGFIIGFAAQDTLSNLAAGLMLLVHRPFDVGHVVEAGGVNGKVRDLNLVATTILTPDNQRLVVPNSKIWGDVIRNITAEPLRRVDLTFGAGYDDDIEKVERVLLEILEAHELVLDEPEPSIKLHNLGDSTVDFIVRPWVQAEDYWTVYWDVTREVKRRFDAEGISIPYPQRDVHVHKVETN